ncbi:hypothetical protein HZF02_01885 [Pseudomonas yamanorum]|nr:hypothetical protein HZF02_01885 [Pseudomonas yamanorum]
MKINAMTQELYQGFDTTNKTGWGKSDAVRLPDGTNMNNLPYINAIYTLTGTNNTNVPEGTQNGHIMVQCADIFVRQTFRQMGANVTWERGGQQGGSWSPWARLAQVGSYLGNGLGGQNSFDGNIDTIVATAPNGLSAYSLSATATGGLPPGFVNNAPFSGSTLMCLKWNNDWCRQWLSGGTGGNGGAVGGTYTRLIAGGSQGPWLLEYNIQNALNPVDNANGRTGLMDNRFFGAWRVCRQASGVQVASVPYSDVSLASGEIKNFGFSAPVAFPDWGKCSIQVDAIPSANTDHYGVTTRYMQSSQEGYFAIRNGSVAQNFTGIRLTIHGYWK